MSVVYRNIKGMRVRQSLSTEYLNATDMLKVYNENRHPTQAKKQLPDYLRLNSTEEFKRAINHNVEDSLYLKPEKLVVSTRGKNGGTYMHPLLFIDFCMWLSPSFKLWAVMVVQDKLIELRNNNKDAFKRLTNTINSHLEGNRKIYSTEIMMINEIAYGRRVKGRRDYSSERELALLKQLQLTDSLLIEQGFDSITDRRRILNKFKKLLNWD